MRWCWGALVIYGSISRAWFDLPLGNWGPRARSSWLHGDRGFCCGRQDRLFLICIGSTVVAAPDELFLAVLLLVCHNKIINKDIQYNTMFIINIIISPLPRGGSLIVIVYIAIWGGCEIGGLRCFCRVGSLGSSRFLCEWNCNDFRTYTNYCS